MAGVSALVVLFGAIVLASLLGTLVLTPIFWLILLGIVAGVAVAQSLRWIERVDLFLIAVGSTAAIFFLPILRSALFNVTILERLLAVMGGNSLYTVLVVAGVSALVVLFGAIVFRLIYKLVAQIL
ncbi:hypothetical protein [Leptolyngbya ohadii]|uniref:hypothetical protein n=1 Tax=Leptolyngbya ohadii TaxID=1962290 RepID=UPI0015C6527B|nr:hypothetical protein [Leptolyngbya ohadii]